MNLPLIKAISPARIKDVALGQEVLEGTGIGRLNRAAGLPADEIGDPSRPGP
jgi:hypothetical protein